MLFNSYLFIFVFLPLALLIYHSLRCSGWYRTSFLSLILLSLVFYGWWNPTYLLLLVPLTLANYRCAQWIVRKRAQAPMTAKRILIAGLVGNLAVLGYFKYANFFIDNVNTLFGLELFFAQIVLPLGISFFTFQKVAFLLDAYRGKLDDFDLLDFLLFVSFFPQLIAGPIVHHSEVLPQFRRKAGVTSHEIMLGLTFFCFGLAKKMLLADTAALYTSPSFLAAAGGTSLTFFEAWSAALSYTMQLYFDFSGYCDMAIGAALLFGIRLPLNFHSPYKAQNIIDFWRRWHMTLSRFLRDYLYISLGGNRGGTARRYLNLMLTMLLGGLWHGANWTFVVWGGLHGAYLIMNHAWIALRKQMIPSHKTYKLERIFGQMLTFIAVVVAWVFFRAPDTATALRMLHSMAGMNELGSLTSYNEAWLWIGLFSAIVWFAPNTQQMLGYAAPAGSYAAPEMHSQTVRLRWQPTLPWAILTGAVFALSIMSLSHLSEFIYFQF